MNSSTMLSTSPWIAELPTEIWTLVADQIADPRSLRALICTCRTFNVIFLPALYRDHLILLHLKRPSRFLQEPLSVGIKHTRSLEIRVHEFMQYDGGYDESLNQGYASYISGLLRAMPHLNSFEWDDCCLEVDNGPSLMLRDPELLSTLKQCPNLRHLSVTFAGIRLVEAAAQKCFTNLDGFLHLTSLELYSFYGEEVKVIRDINIALRACKKLKRLGLGKAHTVYAKVDLALVIDDNLDFLERLCLEYSAKNTPPLMLETLRIGEGLFLTESSTKENYLAKLVDLSKLKTLHIWNGLVVEGIDDLDPEPINLDWSLLNGCTSLHQLEVSRLEDDARRWLQKNGKTVRELVVLEGMTAYDSNMRNFSKIPNLTMLFMTEGFTQRNFYIESDYDTESDIESQSGHSSSEGQYPVEACLFDEVADSPPDGYIPDVVDTQEEVEDEIDIAIKTVLDRLPDHGSSLQKLAMNLDLNTQWAQFSTHLPNLKKLTQFRVEKRQWYLGLYPEKSCSLWPGIVDPKEIARCYAKLMRWKCPSLQFVRFGDWAWQITVPMGVDVESLSEDEVFAQIELRELALEEIMSIYLFSIDRLNLQSGLSAPERITEKDRRNTERWRIQKTEEGTSSDEDSDEVSEGTSEEDFDEDSDEDLNEMSDGDSSEESID